MKSRCLIVIAISVFAAAVLALASDAQADTVRPPQYTIYLPAIFNSTSQQHTEVITIPIGWMATTPGMTNNVIRIDSFGHTHADAWDPSGNHVCVVCEKSEMLLADMVYEADYGTWYYISRAFVSVPIPDVRIISAALRIDLCTYAYQYSGPLPALQLNAGTWPDSAFPSDRRALWGAWDPGRVLAEYTPKMVAGDCNCSAGPREKILLPLPLAEVQPGQNLKFTWRLRDDHQNLVNPDGNAPRVVRVGLNAYNSCFSDCSLKSYAVLEIGYIP